MKEKTTMNELLERIRKAGSIKTADSLDKSPLFAKKDMVPTSIPALNIALSGRLDGGLTPGLTFLAGPSRHFKSMFGLMMVKAYLSKYEDAICMFIDSEFGITPEYIKSVGIDTERVLHIPVEHIEQLKFDLVKRLEEIKRGDKVIVFIDSIGNLASKKEVDDALEEKSVADMTRAKSIKSLFRIITPHFTTKDIPCVVVNHTYQEQGLYPKTIMSGGTGPMYSANTIFIIGRQQEKDGGELAGYNFIINVEKSRYVREKSKIPITVKFDGGLSRWSGLMDMALEGKFVVKPSNGWYSRVDCTTGEVENKKWRLGDTDTKEFWLPVISDKAFQIWIKNNYQISSGELMTDEHIDQELAEIDD
jgi:RecA/RadA recombinase